jgi:ADP-heptose:LPS heptosyltransferase
MSGASPRILVIRRDNIGDLACTTPLLHALRSQLPKAYLAALVTQYNAAVLAGNPDLDAIHSYTKAKHRAAGESVLRIYGRRLKQVMQLRNERFDWVLLPGGPQASSMRTARWVRAKRILVRDNADAVAGPHEVEQCCHLLSRMGLKYETPSLRLAADPAEIAQIADSMRSQWPNRPRSVIGLHISARKVRQRWPVERFTELARRLHATTQAALMLLWAPGGSDDPLHPGDDEKSDALQAALADVPILPVRTARLEPLIAALSQCDRLICSDGGAMHLAAALGKPIVCLFGNSDAARWCPWGVPYELLQPPSRDAADISVGEVLDAYDRLSGR